MKPESTLNGMKPSSNEAPAGMAAAQFKLLLLVGMVLQNSSTVLVGRYTRAGVPKEDQFDVNHLVLVIECGKFLLSCGLEFYFTHGKLAQSLQLHVFDHPYDALKIMVPALLYLLQNTLLYVALANLTAPLFQVTYQAKLVTTAIVSVFMLDRSYSSQQWVCLVALSLGVATVVLGEGKDDGKDAATDVDLPLGLLCVSVACLSSALAGVYFEKVLKKPANDPSAPNKPAASLWMRNIQLSFFSVLTAALQGAFKGVPPERVGLHYLHGFSAWAWVLVFLQAGGGLLVAAVIKYADNVLKGLATGVSVVLATACSMVLFGTPITAQFTIGGIVILTAVYFFSNPLPINTNSPQTKKDENVVEVNKLLPK